MVDLTKMSADALETLARRASALAEDMKAKQPSYALAIEAGVRDRSYNTVANGYVNSYSGEAIVRMDDGKRWRCVGHRPKGSAFCVTKRGFIEFIPLGDDS